MFYNVSPILPDPINNSHQVETPALVKFSNGLNIIANILVILVKLKGSLYANLMHISVKEI